MKTLLLSLLTFVCFSHFGQHQVGHYQSTFQDPERANRDIQTEIYYPATTAGESTPSATGQFPVIVFGHGFVMAWSAYENHWLEFVERGYIMVFPRTEGNAFSTDHQQFGWDLEFLVTEMQVEGNNSSSPIYNHVHDNTALMGHSMGGGASFLAADSLCSNGNLNIKTLIGLAPAESSSNGVSSINSSLSITVPSVILSGSQDGVTPPVDHHIPMYDNLASDCKTFVSVTGGAHCYFANANFNCDFGEGTSSTGISITREEQHDVTFSFLNNWLDYTLKDDCNAFQLFQDSVSQSNRVTTNQTCVSNPISVISESNGILTSSISGMSYQWYLNGNAISAANGITHVVSTAGDYTVEVIFSSGCPTVSAPFTYNGSSVNISENNKNFNVYPNPTNGLVTLSEFCTVEIYSIEGKRINLFTNINSIDLGNYNSGVYLLKIENSFIKIIKE